MNLFQKWVIFSSFFVSHFGIDAGAIVMLTLIVILAALALLSTLYHFMKMKVDEKPEEDDANGNLYHPVNGMYSTKLFLFLTISFSSSQTSGFRRI